MWPLTGVVYRLALTAYTVNPLWTALGIPVTGTHVGATTAKKLEGGGTSGGLDYRSHSFFLLHPFPVYPHCSTLQFQPIPFLFISSYVRGKCSKLQGCRGDEISIPIPIPCPQKILWVSPQDPHTHRTPKSYTPIPASCLFTTRGLF